MGFPGGTEEYRIPGGKESACNAENPGSILGSGRSPGEGNGYPWIHTLVFLPGEFHGQQSLSSILAWRISWTTEPDGLQSMRLQRGGHD